MADRVAIIDHGRLLMLDTPSALKQSAGEGDVLEIEIAGGAAEMALAALAGVPARVALSDHALVIRARGAVELLPSILDALRAAGLPPGEVRLRANSLEDVFISLTGRKLRE
jgi:ABC-2 type transport system ATP-binding protein